PCSTPAAAAPPTGPSGAHAPRTCGSRPPHPPQGPHAGPAPRTQSRTSRPRTAPTAAPRSHPTRTTAAGPDSPCATPGAIGTPHRSPRARPGAARSCTACPPRPARPARARRPATPAQDRGAVAMRRDAVVDPSFEFPRLKLSPCGAVSVARIHKRSHRFLSIQSTCFMITTSMGLGPELPYLEAFRAVCVEGGFTAAARKLGCTQPAISYQVRKLEKLLGVRLLERDGRRVVLTPAGRRFRAFADRVFAELAEVRTECAAGNRVEPLRLGSASGFGRYVLLPALRAVQAEVGGVEVRLQYDAVDVVMDRLEAGEYEA